MGDKEGTKCTVSLQEAVSVISKLSGARILPHYEKTTEGDITKVTIPTTGENPSDRKDTAMRRYLSDWVKGNMKNTSVDTYYEKLPRGTAYYTEDKEYSVHGCIVIQWWPRKFETEYETYKRMNKKGKSHEST
jgi:hypothetical protein